MEHQKQPVPIFKRLWFKLLIALAALVLFILLMDQVAMPWYVRLGQEVELPDVVEMPLNEAQKKLQGQGFVVIISDSVYNAQYAAGTVVEQMPLPFSIVKKDRHVYLKVSIGEKPIIMPNLFYKSPRDAELLLQSYGLKLQAKIPAYSDLSPAGVVIAQSFPAGQVVKRNTPIRITVSLGPFPKRKTVPDLLGKSLDTARRQLRLLGVRKIDVRYIEQDNMLPETVIDQKPAGGVAITDSTQVELSVSKVKKIEE